MSTDIARRASLNGGSRAGAAQPPKPSLSESAQRQDKLDNDQFEKQAADLAKPTLTRPALIAAEEVDKIRSEYGTGSGRLNVLGKVTGKRLDYWTEHSGGGAPFDPITDTERARCQAFFEKYGVRLADQPRQAPPNPLRREPAKPAEPAAQPAAAEPRPLETAERLPDAVGGAVRGGITPPPPATFEIECVLDGFPCKLTLHATSGIAVLEQGGAAIAKLKAQKATPPPAPVVAVPKAEAAAEETPLCAIHHTPMAKRQGKNGSFWSCPQKLEDGSWCPYKPK